MKLNKKQFELLNDFHVGAQCEWGTDGHSDGSDAILYGILKLLGYEDIPYCDEEIKKDDVDKMVESYSEDLGLLSG